MTTKIELYRYTNINQQLIFFNKEKTNNRFIVLAIIIIYLKNK